MMRMHQFNCLVLKTKWEEAAKNATMLVRVFVNDQTHSTTKSQK